MDYIANLFNDSVYNLISVLSDPMLIAPVGICIIITFLSYLVFRLLRR